VAGADARQGAAEAAPAPEVPTEAQGTQATHAGTSPAVEKVAAPPTSEKTAASPAVEKTAPPQAHAGEGATEQRVRGGRARRLMLVVTDAARMAQVNLLVRSAGYEVRAAFDGQHALGLLRIDRPDLLLLDYDLRGMDGVETLRRLAKQAGAAGPPPTLLLLPDGREELRREALEAGARRVVRLPYDPVELLDALREADDETE
jgi:CheY-like chemotaxis protein